MSRTPRRIHSRIISGNMDGVAAARAGIKLSGTVAIWLLPLLLYTFLSAYPVLAQTVDTLVSAPKDTLVSAPKDSLTVRISDSISVTGDTTLRFETKNSIDTIVTYSAKDSILYILNDKKMILHGSADIKFGVVSIKAAEIAISWEGSTMTAIGVPDTAKNRQGKLIGTPVFRESNDEYRGKRMTYNFKSKKGVIEDGETAIDEGFYLGERIKRQDEGNYFIQNGRYTTCDNPDHKHYYFGSPKMKFVPKDVIVAEPIFLFVEDIPLFAFPFAVIPSKSGRASGILFPTFGDHPSRGRYLMGGGYFFALSDYYDLKLTGDWYSKGGYQVKAGIQYALRYNFTGSINLSYGRQQYEIGNTFSPDDQPRTDYEVNITHNQRINPSSALNVNFTFVTNTYYNNFSNNINELLNQNARSNASYSKSWEGTNRSMYVNASRDQYLRDWRSPSAPSIISQTTLPDISFSQSQIFPFKRSESFGNEAWYEMIGFNYSGHATNVYTELKRTNIIGTDTTLVKDLFSRIGVQQDVSLIASPKLGYFTVSPSFSFKERWYDHRIERSFTPGDSLVRWQEKNGFFMLHTFSASVSASTKLYGTVQPNIAGIMGIRHTMQPSLSFSYYPDFSKDSWGYYGQYRDSLNQVVRYDPYTGYQYLPGEIFGGAGSGESQTMGMRLSNVFEMKLNPAVNDTTQTPRKFQLFSLDLSTNYNLVRDSKKLDPINVSFRTNVQNLLDIYGGATFSPYVFLRQYYVIDDSGRYVLIPGQESSEYIYKAGGGLVRLTSFDFHLSTSLSNETFSGKQSAPDSASIKAMNTDTEKYSFKIPWNLSLGYDYSYSLYNPDAKSRSSSLRASLAFSLTPKWKFTASAYYDLVAKELGTPQISIYRDLHCWEMSFNWVPAGYYRNYYLVIRLKASQLQDIKLEKKGSDRGVY